MNLSPPLASSAAASIRKSPSMSYDATSDVDTESSTTTSSTLGDEGERRIQEQQPRPPSSSRPFDTPPPSPCRPSHVKLSADRQPPSPLAATATTEKIPLAPCLSRPRPDTSKVADPVAGIPPDHRRPHRRRRRRNVTFTTVTIHHHPPCLADNPAVSDGGAPVGLGWARTHTDVHDVDEYEYGRQMAGHERRTVPQLRMGSDKRRVLLRKAGHTDREVEDMIAEVRRVQIGRARTNGGSGGGGSGSGSGSALLMFDLGGKTRRVKEAGARAKRHVGRVVGAMDRAATIRIQPVGRAVLEFEQQRPPPPDGSPAE